MIRLGRRLERAAYDVVLEMRAAGLVSRRFRHDNINYIIAAFGEPRSDRGTYFGPVEVEGVGYAVYMMAKDLYSHK